MGKSIFIVCAVISFIAYAALLFADLFDDELNISESKLIVLATTAILFKLITMENKE